MSTCRLASARALLTQLESQAADVATASAAASTRQRELEQQQEELKQNLKVCKLLFSSNGCVDVTDRGRSDQGGMVRAVEQQQEEPKNSGNL